MRPDQTYEFAMTFGLLNYGKENIQLAFNPSPANVENMMSSE